MNREQSVIDAIDELVDEQLTQESSGYDHNINQPLCRCGRYWHGLPSNGCPGSDAQGPIAYSKALVKLDPAAGHAELAAIVEIVQAAINLVVDQIVTAICGSAAAVSAIAESVHDFRAAISRAFTVDDVATAFGVDTDVIIIDEIQEFEATDDQA